MKRIDIFTLGLLVVLLGATLHNREKAQQNYKDVFEGFKVLAETDSTMIDLATNYRECDRCGGLFNLEKMHRFELHTRQPDGSIKSGYVYTCDKCMRGE